MNSNCAMDPPTSLVPEVQYEEGYFFPLSLKFSAM